MEATPDNSFHIGPRNSIQNLVGFNEIHSLQENESRDFEVEVINSRAIKETRHYKVKKINSQITADRRGSCVRNFFSWLFSCCYRSQVSLNLGYELTQKLTQYSDNHNLVSPLPSSDSHSDSQISKLAHSRPRCYKHIDDAAGLSLLSELTKIDKCNDKHEVIFAIDINVMLDLSNKKTIWDAIKTVIQERGIIVLVDYERNSNLKFKKEDVQSRQNLIEDRLQGIEYQQIQLPEDCNQYDLNQSQFTQQCKEIITIQGEDERISENTFIQSEGSTIPFRNIIVK